MILLNVLLIRWLSTNGWGNPTKDCKTSRVSIAYQITCHAAQFEGMWLFRPENHQRQCSCWFLLHACPSTLYRVNWETQGFEIFHKHLKTTGKSSLFWIVILRKDYGVIWVNEVIPYRSRICNLRNVLQHNNRERWVDKWPQGDMAWISNTSISHFMNLYILNTSSVNKLWCS